MRFLMSRRWVLFGLTVVLLAYVAVLLGQWQFHRLHERKHSNGVVARNLAAPPVPLQDVLTPDRAPSADTEWQRVTATGKWDDKHTLVLKYQTRDEGAGVDVITPLVTENGSAILVDRGWMTSENSGAARPKLPKASSGLVTVTGYVRRDATGGSTRVSELATRAVSSRTIGHVLDYPLYRGFLDLAAESPQPAHRLAAVELPDDHSNGPHFFYGLQWWFFGVLAVFGFFYFAYDELRRRREGLMNGASEGTGHPPVDRQHRPAHEG